MNKKIKFFYKYIGLCLFITLIVTTFVVIFYNESRKILNDSIESRLTSNLKSASLYFDTDIHKEIRVNYELEGFSGNTKAGHDDSDYIDIVGNLEKLAKSINATYIYTIRLKNNTNDFYFVLDSSYGTEDQTYVGQTYYLDVEESNFFKNSLNNPGEVFILEINDEYGEHLTACVALLDSSNNIEAILCVDISPDFLNRHGKLFLWVVIVLETSLLFVYLGIGYYIYRLLKRNEEMQEKIEHMAYYDSLTSLPNRVALIDKLNQMMESLPQNKGYSIALFFIDVDNFKKVNDSEGHITGDILLQTIAKFLMAHSDLKPLITKSKEFVARLGGDEFVMLLAIKDKSDIHKFCNILLSDFLKLKANNQLMLDYNVSLSIGAAIYPENADSVSGLLKAADIAMYKAKKNSKGTYDVFKNENE